MDRPTISSQLSRRLLTSIRQSRSSQLQNATHHNHQHLHPRRHASSSPPSDKPITLEPPSRFRPPSHPRRLNARRTTTPLMSGGGYNQGATAAERAAQRTRRYPHMFPNEGTLMYRFLTSKTIHVWISLGVLSTLALFTLTTSFLRTSPFAHLLPPLSTLPFHPINYIREYFSIIRLHIDYQTEQTAKKRQEAILDAQKRRLYRRAHGLEDTSAAEDTGVDVRGFAEWDDGLTDVERQKGGRKTTVMTGRQIFEQAGEEAAEEAFRRREEQRKKGEKGGGSVGSLDEIVRAVGGGQAGEGEEGGEVVLPQKRKVKRWFGIWE